MIVRGSRLPPPFSDNGYLLFSRGIDLWQPGVSEFLEHHGFPAVHQP